MKISKKVNKTISSPCELYIHVVFGVYKSLRADKSVRVRKNNIFSCNVLSLQFLDFIRLLHTMEILYGLDKPLKFELI